MKVSMLLATLNRRELMLNAIQSILCQNYQEFEIIVIDQSDVENSDIVELDSRIRYFHIAERGLSRARNIGLKYITGDIVGLMDDDAVYPEDVLNKVNELFSRNNNLGLISGAVVDKSTNRISLRGMGDCHKKINKKNIFQCCISPSMFIRKDIFDSDEFDEQLGLGNYWGSAEETDIALKVLYRNYEALFCPDIVVYHPGCDKKDLPFSKLESYSRGFGAVCAKHFNLYDNKVMHHLYKKSIFRAIGGYCLSILKFSSHMRKYYKISMRAKREGYKSYKYQLREKNDS